MPGPQSGQERHPRPVPSKRPPIRKGAPLSEKPRTLYRVHSKNTGAEVCGPYEKKHEAERERDRLNREAATGVGADGEAINYQDVYHCAACQTTIQPAPRGTLVETSAGERRRIDGVMWCSRCESHEVEMVSVAQLPQPITHDGVRQQYEIRTDAGVIL